MKKSHLLGVVCACLTSIISYSAYATLISRDLDGDATTAEAYYDDVANLTWLANANYAGTTMDWATANNWAATLDPYSSGISGWRLPISDTCIGYNCTNSEMGNLFYNVLGGTAGVWIDVSHNDNYDLFSGTLDYNYWSATEHASVLAHAWFFSFSYGDQGFQNTYNSYYALAVHDGDVGAAVVPVPAALWLFFSGLLGLIGFSSRNRIH